MYEENLIQLADKIAESAHKGQTRWDNSPYITHPRGVANAVRQYGGEYVVVALLHDVVEDTPITLDDLRENFPEFIVEAVDAISKEKGDDYWEYLDRVKVNDYALVVKIADTVYNRADLIKNYPHKVSAIEKYNKALKILGAE